VNIFDVIAVGMRLLRIKHDDRFRLIGLRAESHPGVLRQDGVTTDQTGHYVVGEAVEEDRQHPREKSRQAGVVDEVEQADFAP